MATGLRDNVWMLRDWTLRLKLGLAFLTLLLFVLASVFTRFPGDLAILLWLQSPQSPWLTKAAMTVSYLGDTPIALSMMGVAVFLPLVWRRRDVAVMMLLSLVPIGAGNLLKLVVGRTRPEYLLLDVAPTSLSFPSGHALFAAIFWGLLVWLAEESIQSPLIRRSVQVALGLLILAVGWSRVYLGLHWPSDVIGGYMYGLLAVWLLTLLRRSLLYKI
ncbi:MAG: phosphatase PAP2 family protein [Chloroflexi bacterium]|nr:phosphatase PAP2 family protein [Chloroflexota bacterium]